ncbi:hypothetical protein MOO46_07305 (plasmid) [Apilactobacillus apisilvae]|uniref:Single-stranded DNA-binding protein n=1 Tax=Apilactobacillus apisilvae TaxID=2923364 RepID=A0ABY4PK74_9LACO|nr:hypothetical protein [Apilactobacillus apisilvae]UQS85791.1 hypothetical protein MOO46_07305 [Apilactobacillus apisilvae]
MRKPNKKVVDRKNKVSNFIFNAYPQFIMGKIHCINLGRIIKYDKADHTCSVQLLPLQHDNDKIAPINEVIVPASIWQNDKAMEKIKDKISIEYKSLKVGSVVTIGFFDTEIDNFAGKDNFKIDSTRKHSLNDATLLGVIEP